MSRVLGVRLLLTLFALVCVTTGALIAFGVVPGSYFPVVPVLVHDGQYRVQPNQQPALPDGLRPGDLLSLRRLSPADRATLFSHHDVLPGTVITLPIVRDGRSRDVPIAAVPDMVTPLQRLQFLGFLAAMLAIAMLTLWRGRDWAAWGLSAMFLSALFVSGPLQLPLAPQWVFWQHEFTMATRAIVMIPAMFVFADALAGANLPLRLRWMTRVTFALLLIASLALAEVYYTELVGAGMTLMAGGYREIRGVLVVPALGVLLFLLLAGYRFAAHADRLRIRWVLWSTVLLVFSNLLVIATPAPWHATVDRVVVVPEALALLGYLYAVLRTRLIDVGFVIDRALVFVPAHGACVRHVFRTRRSAAPICRQR